MFKFVGKKHSYGARSIFYDVLIEYDNNGVKFILHPKDGLCINDYEPNTREFKYGTNNFEMSLDTDVINIFTQTNEGPSVDLYITDEQSILSFIKVLNEWYEFVN